MQNKDCLQLPLTVFACILVCLSPITFLAANEKPMHWSVDLTPYGYPAAHLLVGKLPLTSTSVRATSDNIAVALDVQESTDQSLSARVGLPWTLSLLIFGAKDGNLRAKCGPWTTNSAFDLWATAGGNFLLHLEPLVDTQDHATGKLLLLSPSCQSLHELALPHSQDSQRAWLRFAVSPSGRTLLMAESEGPETTYELRNTDTLSTISTWIADPGDPVIDSVSDTGLIAVKPFLEEHPALSERTILYRTFQEASWRTALTSSGDVSLLFPIRFLSNDTILEAGRIGKLGPCADTETSVRVARIDGTILFSTAVRRSGYAVGGGVGFVGSSDGHFFGDVLEFDGVGGLWCFLDMGPGYSKAYIWSSSDTEPIKRISLHRQVSVSSPLAFAPDGSWYALLDNNVLSLSALNVPHRTPSE